MRWDEEAWEEAVTRHRYKPQPELREDVLFMMLNLNPLLEKLIDRFDLDIES